MCVHKISFEQHFTRTVLCLKRYVWNMCKNFFEGTFMCAGQVFLYALVSRHVCAHTRSQLRGNIGLDYYPGVVTRASAIHRQHSPSGPIVGQSEPSEQSAIDDNWWSVRADVSRWCYSLNSPSHGLYNRLPMQYYSRFRTVFVFEEAGRSSKYLIGPIIIILCLGWMW